MSKEFNDRITRYYWNYNKRNDLEYKDIINGRILKVNGLEEESEEVKIEIEKGNNIFELIIYHEQDCCENVRLLEFHGTIDVNSTLKEIKINTEIATDVCESGTWTFITIETETSTCTLRFLGESNGCYSEHVNFYIRIRG